MSDTNVNLAIYLDDVVKMLAAEIRYSRTHYREEDDDPIYGAGFYDGLKQAERLILKASEQVGFITNKGR